MLLLPLLFGCLSGYVFRELRPRQPVDPTPVGAGLATLSAEECGACHQEIYAEWRGSAMGQAFTNPAFQADWALDNEFYYCLTCHSPLLEQQPELVSGIAAIRTHEVRSQPNPVFDADLQQEGVTCLACHLTDAGLAGPHAVEAPHETVHQPDFAGAQRCEGCHQLQAPPVHWLDRPISDTHNEWQRWQAETGRTESCVDCHMPAVTRASVPGFPEREGRRHTFPGTRDPELMQDAVLLDGDLDGAQLVLRLTNQAGHNLPSTDPANRVQVRVQVLGPDGVVLQTLSQTLQRRIEGNREREDSTLLPAETRELTFGLDSAPGATVTAEVVYQRLAGLREPVQEAARTEGPLETVLRSQRWLVP
jgi:hypothetical protein